ncbi:hypothetical protein MHYP_G00198200 [Metynnis hypsauchen]
MFKDCAVPEESGLNWANEDSRRIRPDDRQGALASPRVCVSGANASGLMLKNQPCTSQGLFKEKERVCLCYNHLSVMSGGDLVSNEECQGEDCSVPSIIS